MNWTWKGVVILLIACGVLSYLLGKLPIYILSLLIGTVLFSIEYLIEYIIYKRKTSKKTE